MREESGVVTNCLHLYVKDKPQMNASTVCVIEALTDVLVDENESTEDFYKIYTAIGIEGFCPKKFIAIRR